MTLLLRFLLITDYCKLVASVLYSQMLNYVNKMLDMPSFSVPSSILFSNDVISEYE